MSACWTKSVVFDRKVYMDFDDPKWLPYEPNFEDLEILDSDDPNRKNFQLRERGKM